MNKDIVGKQFDCLTVIEQLNNNEVICKCICGNEVFVKISTLYNKKKTSCGCQVSSDELPVLNKIWGTFTNNEKSNWGTWNDFVMWSKQFNYCNAYSIHKINRKLPYNINNLEFGLFINKEFFTIEKLKRLGYYYNERLKKFVTSYRYNGKIFNEDDITISLNKQKNKHKTLSKKLFKKLKNNKLT